MDFETDLLNLTEDALIIRDFDDCIRFWNKGAERLYGWREAEAIGRNINDLLQEKLAPSFDGALRGDGEWTGELHQVTRDGRKVVVRSSVKVKRDKAGYPQCVLICNTDITQSKTLERQLLRAQSMATLGKLAGSVAHNLGNELALMLFSTRRLEEKEEDAETRRWLEMFRTGAEHSAGLIARLLTLARGSDDDYTQLHPQHVIREACEILHGVFPKSIEIRTSVPAGLSPITGNATDLRQVILNLCVNARDAMPDGGVLSVEAENNRCASGHDRLLIRISDTGAGMSPEVMTRIFEPLFTTKAADRGTGLGLFTVQRIVTSHRGSIEVSSELGRGTQFKIYLPASNSGLGLKSGGTAHAHEHTF